MEIEIKWQNSETREMKVLAWKKLAFLAENQSWSEFLKSEIHANKNNRKSDLNDCFDESVISFGDMGGGITKLFYSFCSKQILRKFVYVEGWGGRLGERWTGFERWSSLKYCRRRVASSAESESKSETICLPFLITTKTSIIIFIFLW